MHLHILQTCLALDEPIDGLLTLAWVLVIEELRASWWVRQSSSHRKVGSSVENLVTASFRGDCLRNRKDQADDEH